MKKNNPPKVVLWDKMHYMLRRFNDRMIHTCLRFEGKIDRETMEKAVCYMADNVPLTHSTFKPGFFRPCWQVSDYSCSDIFFYKETENAESEAEEFLLNEIPFTSNVQIKIAVFSNKNTCYFAVLTNHQFMDGRDTFAFIKDLFNNYNAFLEHRPCELKFRSGSRSHKEMYADLGKKERLLSHFLYFYRGKIKNGACIDFGMPGNEKRRIVKYRVPSEVMKQVKRVSKEYNVTVNDIMTAALLSSLYSPCKREESEPIALSIAVDLRRKLNDGGRETGYTNHTAWMVCSTENKSENPREIIERVNSETKRAKADPYLGLYSLPLLNTVFSALPFAIAEKIVSIGYGNPPVAMSNIGRIPADKFSVRGATLHGGYMAGSMKDKPYFIMTVSTIADETCFASAINGNENDVHVVEGIMAECVEFMKKL